MAADLQLSTPSWILGLRFWVRPYEGQIKGQIVVIFSDYNFAQFFSIARNTILNQDYFLLMI